MKVPKAKMLPSGTWRVQIMVDGARISVTGDTEAKATAKALATKERLIEAAKRPRDTITLKEAIFSYIDNRDTVLSPATVKGYYAITRNRFQDLMGKKIYQIDESVLQSAINNEAKNGISAKTLKNAMGLVITVLSEYKAINAKRLRYPQRKKSEHLYLDGNQIVKLISACNGDIAEIPILMGLWLGLRRSEIFGLQWESVDFINGKIQIDHSLVYDKDENAIIKETMKTETSNRVLDCPHYILKKLEEYQPDPEKRVGSVFSMHPNTLYKNLEKICKRAGLPRIGAHGLRHTNASVMLSLGIVDKIAMSRGGWSSKDTMERIYQHLFDADKAAADDAINAYFEKLIAHEISHEEIKTLEQKAV